MNRITLATLCTVVLFAFACKTHCPVELDKPVDIKPIDWKSYNDVRTVFWNILSDDCSGAGYPTGDTIMVYGKISTDRYEGTRPHFYALIDEQEQEEQAGDPLFDFLFRHGRYPGACVYVNFTDKVRKHLDTCDLTKRCYIKDELITGMTSSNKNFKVGDYCCFVGPSVFLKNIDNIYFEE